MWYPVLAQQEVLAERKQAAFLLAESAPLVVPLKPSQVQSVPRWKMLVQAAVALLVLLSQQAFSLLMFPVRARIGLPARGEQPAAFRVSPKLDAGTVAQMHQRSVYALAFLAACRLPEEPASPRLEKPIRAQTDFPVTGFAVDIPSVPQ